MTVIRSAAVADLGDYVYMRVLFFLIFF